MELQTLLCSTAVLLFLLLLFISFRKQKNLDIYLKKFIEYNNNITIVTDETDILMVNSTGLHFFGFSSLEALLKKTRFLSKLFSEVVTGDVKYVQGIKWVTQIPKNQNVTVQMQSGPIKQTFTMQVSKINDARYMVTFHNISKVVAEKKAISQVAEKDELTRIFNRAKFNTVLNDALRNAQIYDTPFSLIMFDIDHFKKVNDTYGHDIGDKVLIQVSALVKNMLHGYDTFARWGGEEFVILAESTNENEAHMLANRLREAIEHFPFEFVKQITCSFGVSQYRKGESAETLLKSADEALYRAKESGRNTVCISSDKTSL